MILSFDQVPADAAEVVASFPWSIWLVLAGLLVLGFIFIGKFTDDLGR